MKMAIGLILASFFFCFSINKCVLLFKSLLHTMLAYLHWQPGVQTCYDYYHFMIITFFVKENAISYKWTYNWKFKTIFPGLHDWCQFSWLKWNICNPNFTTCGWLKPQSHWACDHVTTYIRPQKRWIADKSLTDRTIDLRSSGRSYKQIWSQQGQWSCSKLCTCKS